MLAALWNGLSTRQTSPPDLTAWLPETDHMSMTVMLALARPAANVAAKPEIPVPTMTRSPSVEARRNHVIQRPAIGVAC